MYYYYAVPIPTKVSFMGLDYTKFDRITIDGINIIRSPLWCGIELPDEEREFLGIPPLTEVVAHKQKRLAECKKKKDVGKFIALHERPYRFDALLMARGWASSQTQWLNVAGWVWTDAEDPGINLRHWKQIFHSPGAKFMMDADDTKFFNQLPKTFTIYRAARPPHILATDGIAWTTSLAAAHVFMQRYKRRDPLLLTSKIDKTAVLCAFNGRKECEVIVDFSKM